MIGRNVCYSLVRLQIRRDIPILILIRLRDLKNINPLLTQDLNMDLLRQKFNSSNVHVLRADCSLKEKGNHLQCFKLTPRCPLVPFFTIIGRIHVNMFVITLPAMRHMAKIIPMILEGTILLDKFTYHDGNNSACHEAYGVRIKQIIA